ncbi:MAG: pilus assembly protein PilX [Rhodoferax sp.]|nr:pilus assembly protein PilX [Rhodoferax sp.]
MQYPSHPQRPSQRGASMLIALFALVLLLLGATALVRSVDTSTLIAGNLAFKQDATEAAGVGSEQAMAWMEAKMDTEASTFFESDYEAAGYYASSMDNLDPTGASSTSTNKLRLVDWDDDTCAKVPAGTYDDCVIKPWGLNPAINVNGNSVKWLIVRLCKTSGPITSVNWCSKPPPSNASTSASERGELGAGGRIAGAESGPYFRVIVRVIGPRGTASLTETILHF